MLEKLKTEWEYHILPAINIGFIIEIGLIVWRLLISDVSDYDYNFSFKTSMYNAICICVIIYILERGDMLLRKFKNPFIELIKIILKKLS